MAEPDGRQKGAEDPDEATLVQRAREGDREAFGALVRRYQRLVFRVVGGFLRNPADVEDVAQEAFVKAFTAMSTFHPGAPFAPWMIRIATRASYDRLRQRRRASETAWEDLAPGEQRAAQDLMRGTQPEDQTAARDLAERALACLAPKDRQALILTHLQGYTTAEVAETMGCSALAVRLRLHRGRRAMRQTVEGLLNRMKDAE
ncbi:MAG TPA: sigma-70 family RNA polymerase sigma factor [Candidatus Methylomirabilis sp.]|nr:sigma-70 family RNA polymerase sigma factor [Candidatus Methylomirabilis sp.]